VTSASGGLPLHYGLITNGKFCFTRLAPSRAGLPTDVGARTPIELTLRAARLRAEGEMKRQWRLHRQTIQHPDASRRWDRAYQSILQWALEAEPDPAPSANAKEERHAGSGIRPRLESGSGEARDH
jgi:hypothetical protein